VKEFTETATEEGQTYASTTSDESAVLVQTSGVTGTIVDATVTKSGDTSSADNSSFYGQNAATLATDGTLNINGGTITSTAEGGAGAAAYDAGVVNIKNTTISTSSNAAGGIHACGGGTVNAWDLSVTTEGEHSAAIRSDRGGGTMRVDGGTYVSNGAGSPAVYSTADIAVNGATLTANGSEGVAIEGRNSVRLFDCDLTGNMSDDSQSGDIAWGVILYQSNSGDAESGTSVFTMSGGSLTIENGGYFHTNSTDAVFLLDGVTLSSTETAGADYLIRATGNPRWNSGAGSTVTFTARDQTMEGEVIYDSASQLDLYLVGTTTWTGAAEKDTTYTGSYASSIYVGSGSKWVVTADSEIDNLYVEDGGSVVDAEGNTVTITANGSAAVTGTSSLTVTCTTYSATADMSGATATPSWDDYAATNPFAA
jgi:hypothetical protein